VKSLCWFLPYTFPFYSSLILYLYVISVLICHAYLLFTNIENSGLLYLLLTPGYCQFLVVQFLSIWVETRLMAVKEYVYYHWQVYVIHQFIALVHHLLFLRMYNNDDFTYHRM